MRQLVSKSMTGKDLKHWGTAVGVGSVLGGAATQSVTHNKKKTGAAVAGGLGAQGAYQGTAYGANKYIDARTGTRLKRTELTAITEGKKKPGILRADMAGKKGWEERNTIARRHRAANTKAGVVNWKEAHRTYPEKLPYHRAVRLIGHTHSGKTGMVAGAAATIGGASLAANAVGNRRPVAKAFPKLKIKARKKVDAYLRSVIEPIDKPIVHHTMRASAAGGVAGGTFGAAATSAVVGHKQKVAKGLYQRESRPSILRAAEMGAGAGLTAWGLGRSRMLGAALGRGVKAANTRGDARALYALRQAQALQGVLARGTAPGERHVRQIQSLDRAINSIPSSLRPEIATAAGLLLASNARPVYRTSYRPVSTNVQFRRVF